MTARPDGPRPGFFADELTERVFASVVALAAEVSVLRERVAELEQSRGGGTAEPDPSGAAENFVADVFGHLTRPLGRA